MEERTVYQRKAESYSSQVFEEIDETAGNENIVLDYRYNLETKRSGYFDPVVWNIYALLTRHYKQKGFTGRDIWSRAYRHAIIIAGSMSDVDVESGESILNYLLSLTDKKKFEKVKLTEGFDIQFIDRLGNVIFEFNAKSLRKNKIIETAKEKLRKEEEIQTKIIEGPKMRKIEPGVFFSPIIPPEISEVGTKKNFSILEAVRKTGNAPKIIEDQFRDLDLCSGYAVSLLAQEYGKDAISKAGLIYYGKILDAWDLKERGLRNNGIEVKASVMDTLVQKKNGKTGISNRRKYYDKLGQFFKNADKGNYPSLITAFQRNTRYTKKILAANKNRSEKNKSMNSHVMVCLGRGPVQSETVRMRTSLRYFLRKKAHIAYGLQKYLKVNVKRRNGDRVEVGEGGRAIIRKQDGRVFKNVHLKNVSVSWGDTVQWQDVMISDFYKGEERVMGLAYYATKRRNILMEYFTLKNVSKSEKGKYKIVDFVQIEKGRGAAGRQLMDKLGLSESGFAYYFAALLDSGVDLSRVTENDLIPVFDMEEVRSKIEAEGGVSRVRKNIVEKNIEKFNRGSLEDFFIVIKQGQSPWRMVEDFFANYFEGSYELTNEEKNFVLRAIDASCPNIDLSSEPPKFEAGEYIYLTWDRIFEIVKYVREKQLESFSGMDYVKIIESGDSPYAFIRDCFNTEAKEINIDINYAMLESLERNYLLKALDKCSQDIDLTLKGMGTNKKFTDFKAGDRMVLRRSDLQKCIKNISEKQKFQKASKDPFLVLKVRKSKKDLEAIKAAKFFGIDLKDKSSYLTIILPPVVRDEIDNVYPGNNLKQALVRNILYNIWINEQSRGGTRAYIKNELSYIEEDPIYRQLYPAQYLVRSIGPFQIRPLKRDLKKCKKIFLENGIKVPETFQNFRSMIKNNLRVSAIVAGQRLMETLNSFENFMKASGEDEINLLNQNLMMMLTTSYNRSTGAIYRAVFQNWAINLAKEAGVRSDVKFREVDALLSEPGKRKLLLDHIIDTFVRVAEKLILEGHIKYNGSAALEVEKIRSNKIAFVNGSLFEQIQTWYRDKTGKSLSFAFTNEELARGSGVFSYGARMFSMPDRWKSVFRDYDKLSSLIFEMKEDYQLEDYSPPPLDLDTSVKEIQLEKKEKFEKLLEESKIDECFTKGSDLLTVYDIAIKLRSSPRGRKKTSLYFGTVVKIEGIQQKGNEIWLKVKVVEGENEGEEGFVCFRREWFNNENAPKITPRLTKRLEKLQNYPKRPLPKDYIDSMNSYMRFLHNYNPEEPPRSAEMMKRSRPTAYEVKDEKIKETVKAIAGSYGYNNQRYFAILPKRGGGGLNFQNLYVIDRENDRIIGFRVSTGRPNPKTETPSGRYVASGTGFKALNYFGSHQGTYVEKYEGHRVTEFLGKIEEFDNKPVYASMTTGLIPIQRRGELIESAGRYFHGTNRENHLGGKASGGCIRMSNLDIVYLASLLNGSRMEFQIIEDKKDAERALARSVELAKSKTESEGIRRPRTYL
ncbi:L,D-transpeptidase family protein [Candidatus Peregrinibacteria bacterium]|nr:L,D-transpeptidase family protein [Candidatus Peregrinibacteria bacterium]